MKQAKQERQADTTSTSAATSAGIDRMGYRSHVRQIRPLAARLAVELCAALLVSWFVSLGNAAVLPNEACWTPEAALTVIVVQPQLPPMADSPGP
jgi:hypothetical protein